MTIDKTSKKKSFLVISLKILATVMVVYVHGRNIFRYGKYDSPTLFLPINVLAATGVPVFMIVSGYLFFRKQIGWVDNLKKKTKRLAVPFAIWSAFWILFELAGHFIMPSRFENVLSWNFSGFLINYIGIPFSSGPLYGPLWYVRDLFLISILSPCLYRTIRKYSWIFWGCSLLLWVFGAKYNVGHVVVLFFLGGAISAKKDVCMIALSPYLKNDYWLCFIFFIFGTICSYSPICYLERIAILLYCLSAFLFFRRFAESKNNIEICDLLSPYIFIIYLIHGKILSIIQILYVSCFSKYYQVVLGFFVLPAICFILCWGIAFVFKKSSPSFYRVCNGE